MGCPLEIRGGPPRMLADRHLSPETPKPARGFLLDYEQDEDDDEESGGGRHRKKPYRYRWLEISAMKSSQAFSN
jgi:hypothetical protein